MNDGGIHMPMVGYPARLTEKKPPAVILYFVDNISSAFCFYCVSFFGSVASFFCFAASVFLVL